MCLQNIECPICEHACSLLDVVDFNRTCEERRGIYLPVSGMPVYYALCGRCGHCFAPQMMSWHQDSFSRLVYNEQYADIDLDYLSVRPAGNARMLNTLLGGRANAIRHLDYGGGNGLLSDLLRQSGWDSVSYDPFVQKSLDATFLRSFDLITAFEVFEHVANPKAMMDSLMTLINESGLLLFSTLVSDGEIAPRTRISWWYAAPRNGHISLFSKESLRCLATQYNLNLLSSGPGLHAFYRRMPAWANQLFAFDRFTPNAQR